MLLLFAAALLLSLRPASATQNSPEPSCSLLGSFEGSEDATLWRDDVVFLSSGLYPSTTQGGLILSLDLSGVDPLLTGMTLVGLPHELGFRPHGIALDNTTQRLYAISHSDALEEEGIFVFDVINGTTLAYLFVLVADELEWHAPRLTWFLNDLAAVEGRSELYASQYGPQNGLKDKAVWRCTWNEADVRADTRLPASCAVASGDVVSTGFNGMNMDPNATRIWANDLAQSRLVVFDRAPNGSLTHVPNGDIALPGIIDNVEYDAESGDLQMGLIFELNSSPPFFRGGGALVASLDGDGAFEYGEPVVTLSQDDHEAIAKYAISTLVSYRDYLVLGSPGDVGLAVCRGV